MDVLCGTSGQRSALPALHKVNCIGLATSEPSRFFLFDACLPPEKKTLRYWFHHRPADLDIPTEDEEKLMYQWLNSERPHTRFRLTWSLNDFTDALLAVRGGAR
jgi:hypothetical protein